MQGGYFGFKQVNTDLKDIDRRWNDQGGIGKLVFQRNVEYTNWELCENRKQTGI